MPLISNPAIFPPVNNTCEPVTSPSDVTWKLEDEITYGVPPPYNLTPSGLDLIYVDSICHPPIWPAEAVIVPSNLAPLANKTPLELTEKFGPNLT